MFCMVDTPNAFLVDGSVLDEENRYRARPRANFVIPSNTSHVWRPSVFDMVLSGNVMQELVLCKKAKKGECR